MQTLRRGTARLLGLLGLMLAALTTLTTGSKAQSSISLQTYHTFSTLYGDAPYAPLVRDANGNFFGVAQQGSVFGAAVAYGNGGYNPGHGTVFELTSAGKLTTLHSFTGGTDGDTPKGLTIDSAGSLYGTTYGGGNVAGGSLGDGVIFKITNPGQATQNYAVLHDFTRNTDGSGSNANPTLDTQGNLFGTTTFGGNGDSGTIWEIPAGGAFKSLYLFRSNGQSVQQTGSNPVGDVIPDGAGNLYGTTLYGGVNSVGTIFELKKAGQTGQSLVRLVSFAGGTDGSYPVGDLTWNAAAHTLYGTTQSGGDANNDGTVWQIANAGQTGMAYSVIHRFAGKTTDGSAPNAGMVQDSAGTLYGTTNSGGAYGDGAIFAIASPGQTGQAETLHYSFSGGADALNPDGGLLLDSSGNLYGATPAGTLNNVGNRADYGTLFRLSPQNVLSVLARFTNDGYLPQTNVVADAAGALYGVTYYGGANNEGEVYKVYKNGAITILHSFNNTDGRAPTTAPVLDAQGNLYGVTYYGDKSNFGNVWEITAVGTFKVLHTFIGGGSDGANPDGLLLDPATGNLYGTTQGWGQYGTGTIFEVMKPGQSGQTYQTLYNFNPATEDGNTAQGQLALDSAGSLYGTTYSGGKNNAGTVWKYTAAGVFSVLHPFAGGNEGANPAGGLTRDAAGDLLGTTLHAGANNAGTIFKMTPGDQSAKSLHTRYSFGGKGDGSLPDDCPTLDAAGNIYGTASNGGANGYGTVWEITAIGAYQTLYSFTGGADGYYPVGGLLVSKSASLFGTTEGTGGTFGVVSYGTVFQIAFPTPTALNPPAAAPGSAAFTLVVTGTNFVSGDKVYWNNAALSTTFVNATSLKASVPAADLVQADTAQVSIFDPATTHMSVSLPFQIAAPNVSATIFSVQRDAHRAVLVTVVIKNGGPSSAAGIAITSATLGGTSAVSGTGTVGTLMAGQSVTHTLTFADTTPSGAASFVLNMTFTGGSYSGTFSVTVP